MSSWTLVEPRLNSIATHARLGAGEAEATHPKKRSSAMTSVTGSPTGKDAPAHGRACCSVNMVLTSMRVEGCDASERGREERRRDTQQRPPRRMAVDPIARQPSPPPCVQRPPSLAYQRDRLGSRR